MIFLNTSQILWCMSYINYVTDRYVEDKFLLKQLDHHYFLLQRMKSAVAQLVLKGNTYLFLKAITFKTDKKIQ